MWFYWWQRTVRIGFLLDQRKELVGLFLWTVGGAFTKLSRALAGLRRTMQDNASRRRTVQSNSQCWTITGQCRTAQDSKSQYRTLQNCADCRAMQDNTGQCMKVQDSAGHCRTLQDRIKESAGKCRTVRDSAEPCAQPGFSLAVTRT